MDAGIGLNFTLETRPAFPVAPRRAHYYGAARGSRSGIPQPDRGHRYDHTGRLDDDADGRGVCGIRKGYAARANQGRLDAAREEGRIGRRRPKLTPQQQAEIRKMVSKGDKTAADAARLFKIHPATVSRLLARSLQPSVRKVNHTK